MLVPQTAPVQFALDAYNAKRENNYVRFGALMRQANYLQARTRLSCPFCLRVFMARSLMMMVHDCRRVCCTAC